jgi:hypothetical protein
MKKKKNEKTIDYHIVCSSQESREKLRKKASKIAAWLGIKIEDAVLSSLEDKEKILIEEIKNEKEVSS